MTVLYCTCGSGPYPCPCVVSAPPLPCLLGANLPALRHWLKSIRESTYLTVQFAALHLGPAFWYNQRLAGIIPQALVTNLDCLEDRHLKVLFRHSVTSLLASCPRAVRPPWLLPMLSKLLPHMHERLGAKWQQLQAAASGSNSGAAANGSQQQQQQQQQLSEEVVEETILREMTREYMVTLSKAVERAAPPGSSGAAAAAAAAAAMAGPPGSAAAAALGGGATAAEQESVVETLWQYDTGAMQALMGTVVAGVCWPDAQSAGKATKICM